MRSCCSSAIGAFLVAASAASHSIFCAYADELLDPGWQLVYPGGQSGTAGGLVGHVFSRGQEPYAVQRPYQAAPAYYQPAPAPQPPALATAPQYSVVVPAQQFRAHQPTYQPAPQYYQQRPAAWAAQQLLARTDPAVGYSPAAGATARMLINPKYERQVVDYRGGEKPGTIIIDTPNFFLYLVLAGSKALRYGIGVGRPGFTWAGVKQISAMREWPDWTPPGEMLQRRPDLPRFIPGGPNNPLGARALYIGSTLYRIHGSDAPWTIGTQVSSGCIRLRNEDVIDLYRRVKVGTKVVVI